MAIRLKSRFPGGNGRFLKLITSSEEPELVFVSEARSGPETLWFDFRIEADAPPTHCPQHLKLTMPFVDNLFGVEDPHDFRPAYHPVNKGWFRASAGRVSVADDGQRAITWTIPYPEPSTEVALCYPYGRNELKALIDKSKGYWAADDIGVSQAGRPITRLSNGYGSSVNSKPKSRGIYLIARQHGGETPGSWVLDGMLRHFSRAKYNPLCIWSVPLADIDSVELGDFGKACYPHDLDCAWGTPPNRHEALVIHRDLIRWKERTAPLLALDLQALGGTDATGVCASRAADEPTELSKEITAWCNVFKTALAKGYAREEFAVTANVPSPPASSFAQHLVHALGIPALCLQTPYALVGTDILTQKGYRDIGAQLADAILSRAIQLEKGK